MLAPTATVTGISTSANVMAMEPSVSRRNCRPALRMALDVRANMVTRSLKNAVRKRGIQSNVLPEIQRGTPNCQRIQDKTTSKMLSELMEIRELQPRLPQNSPPTRHRQ